MNIKQVKAIVEKETDDYILVMNNEENVPELAYQTDIITLAQASMQLLQTVLSLLDDTTDEEKDAVETVFTLTEMALQGRHDE